MYLIFNMKFLKSSIVVQVLSLLTHAYLTKQHYALKLGLSSGPSSCNLNSTFNCDTVAVSSYSSLFGVPIALLALVTHLVGLLILILISINLLEDKERTSRHYFYLTAFIALVSLVMGSISTFALGTYCLYCMATYILSFVALGLSYMAVKDLKWQIHLPDDLSSVFGSQKWVLGLLIAIPAFGFLGNSMVLDSYGFGEMKSVVQESLEQWKQAKTEEFDLKNGLDSLPNQTSPKMTIVEFADFRCSHCRAAATSLHNFLSIYPDVKLVFKYFPLDGTCNSGLGQKRDGFSCQLAYLNYCSQKLSNKGWDTHKWIFDNQERWFSAVDFSQVITEVSGLFQMDSQAIKACTEEEATFQAVSAQAAEGVKAQIQGTPTIFVNGKKLERGQFMPVLKGLHESL